MTDKELKKLSRSELLDMLIYQAEENKKLREELENARLELLKREIAIEKAGTLAEASMYMSGLFDSADRSAKIYLENIEQRKRETDEICQRKIAEAESRVESIISGAIATIRQGSEAYFKSVLQNSAAMFGETSEKEEEITDNEAAV